MPENARRLAAALVGLILLGWGMGVLVLHVAPGFFHGHVDRPVNHWVHAHHSQGLNGALFRVAHLGSETMTLAVALVAAGIWALGRRRLEPLVVLALAYGGAAVIALVDKVAVRRGQAGLPHSLAGLTELGFPSGHATLATAVYGTLAVLLARRTRWFVPAGLVGLALIIGVARVYNGQHEATDVLAGWVLGGLWTWAVAAFGAGQDRLDPAPESAAGRAIADMARLRRVV
ncbi:MAG TPA: phosphatase PAP2 family protein [Acidimicrobiia bacterium]|nr:phosphatase PAP2 family protein [Acidimicrobiia bacterium]